MSGQSKIRTIFGKLSLDRIDREKVAEIGNVFGPVSAVVAVADEEFTTTECRAIASLYETGCRMFAFVGQRSEQSHDRFDEVLELTGDVPMTTYHIDESSDDTAAMLFTYVRDSTPPRMLLIDGSERLSSQFVASLERAVLDS